MESIEIRKIMFFSRYRTTKNHRKAFSVAKELSRVDSRQLGWLAQYIMNGKTHLYEEEAEKALKIKKNLLRGSE